MSATLVRADCKLSVFCNSDNVPSVTLLTKNLLIHIFFEEDVIFDVFILTKKGKH